MKQFDKVERVCPKCGRTYTEHPALSRIDNKTDICPECGCREALEVVGLPKEEIEKTIAVMRNHRKI